MQVFRELYIHVTDPGLIPVIVEAITASLTGDWTRATEDEERLRQDPPGGRAVYCFACRRRARRPAATLFLADCDGGWCYHVANIIPHDTHQLSRSEYNSILEEFEEQFVRPAAARHGVMVRLTEPAADLDRWLSPGAARKLREFCDVANRWTGADHPADRRRWNDFVLAAHRDGAKLPASTLATWLHEDGGWDEGMADDLAGQYEHGRGLLAQADAQPAGV